MVAHVIEPEIGPALWRERVDDDAVVGPRTQSGDARDDEIHVRRMEVMLAVIRRVVSRPGAVVWIGRLGDVRMTILVLGPRVDGEELHPVGVAHDGLVVVVQQVGHCVERLRRRVWPRVATPPAAARRDIELWIVTFDGGRTVAREEVRRVHQESPSADARAMARASPYS